MRLIKGSHAYILNKLKKIKKGYTDLEFAYFLGYADCIKRTRQLLVK